MNEELTKPAPVDGNKIKIAKKLQKSIATWIDAVLLVVFIILTIKIFSFENFISGTPSFIQYMYVGFYYLFFLRVFPIIFFSQTIGQYICSFKVVSKERHERLSLVESFHYSVCFYFLSNSIEVDLSE